VLFTKAKTRTQAAWPGQAKEALIFVEDFNFFFPLLLGPARTTRVQINSVWS